MIKKPQNRLRIIGGKYRGRNIEFPNIDGLRPTPDRVRETLFNWLAPVIHGAECLDLFAGSGALGFEALSRGAKQVTFVDESTETINQLKTNQAMLKCDNLEIIQSSAIEFLKNCPDRFDIIFLDPPFSSNQLEKCCSLIIEKKLLKNNAFIYIETSIKTELSFLSKNWEIQKEKQAGQVKFMLLKLSRILHLDS